MTPQIQKIKIQGTAPKANSTSAFRASRKDAVIEIAGGRAATTGLALSAAIAWVIINSATGFMFDAPAPAI